MFWAFYNHMIRPNELPNSSDYHLFREGVKPMWEVNYDANGKEMIGWILQKKKKERKKEKEKKEEDQFLIPLLSG